jgi:hypothetical protein
MVLLKVSLINRLRYYKGNKGDILSMKVDHIDEIGTHKVSNGK